MHSCFRRMRTLFCYALLLAHLPAQAADSPHYREWLDFTKAYSEEVGGPTGMYAIQDMIELEPGASAHLASGDVDSLRWIRSAPANPLAQVQYQAPRAVIRGSGIEERDLLQPRGEALTLPNGLTVRATLLREKVLKLWLYNAALPARRGFKALDFFTYDPRGVVTGTFRRNAQPVPMSYLDSREQAGTMFVVGTLQVQINGKTYDLKAYSHRNDWNEIEALLLLLRDRTSGKTTYGGGRVVDIHIPKGSPPQSITFDLNTAYSFLCAHSDFFNCPLALANKLDTELTFGEKFPPLFSRDR